MGAGRMTYNAGDPAEVNKKAKIAKSQDRDKALVLQNIMASREGRLWVRGLLESCHIFQSSFAVEATRTAFNEGERNIGLRLLADIMKACPDKYVEMMRETEDV